MRPGSHISISFTPGAARALELLGVESLYAAIMWLTRMRGMWVYRHAMDLARE